MERVLLLKHEEYKKSIKFAMKLWYAGKPKGDWRSTGTKRDIGKYITDHALGKLAEIAFAKFLERNWAIKAKLDFDIHPGASIDRGDLVSIEIGGIKSIPGIKVDMKSTKPRSAWAMVDLKEFENRRYDAYVWVKVDLPLNHLARPIFEAVRNGNVAEIESMIPALKEISAEIACFAWRDEVEKWREFRKGEVVFDPNKPSKRLFSAKTDNKACPVNELRSADSELENLVRKITGTGMR